MIELNHDEAIQICEFINRAVPTLKNIQEAAVAVSIAAKLEQSVQAEREAGQQHVQEAVRFYEQYRDVVAPKDVPQEPTDDPATQDVFLTEAQ